MIRQFNKLTTIVLGSILITHSSLYAQNEMKANEYFQNQEWKKRFIKSISYLEHTGSQNTKSGSSNNVALRIMAGIVGGGIAGAGLYFISKSVTPKEEFICNLVVYNPYRPPQEVCFISVKTKPDKSQLYGGIALVLTGLSVASYGVTGGGTN